MKSPQSRTTGRPTLAKVAELAGVSPITASRALRGVATVDPDLARAVRAAADDLGYIANPAARTLASARSQTVVVLVPSLSNQLFVDLLEAVHDVLDPRGLDMLIGNFHYSRQEEESLIRNYLAYQPCGLLLTEFNHTEAALKLLAAGAAPVVHMMELGRAPGMHSVGFSQEEAGAAVARHLIASGRRRLAYVGAQLDARVLQRGAGFRAVLAEAGLLDPALDYMTEERSSVALGGDILLAMLDRHPDLDGVFFCNDDLAHGAVFEAQRRGIAIPGRVSVVGFNDLPVSAHMVPRLSSVRTLRAEIGRRAAQKLLLLLDGEDDDEPVVDVGFELMVRESS